jgi:hypothetical protein
MLRPLLRASAAVAFAALLAPATPSAAPAPGLAYDEIVRVVINATPPPPGHFQADVAALAASPAPVAQATPAPRKRGLGGLAGIAGAVLSGGGAGGVAGAVAGAAVSDAMANAVQQSLGAQFGALAGAMTAFLQPHLTRYAYYNGWERVEDVTAQTATIHKCDVGQVLHLDLARKTYTIYKPADEPSDAPAATAAPARRGRQAPADPAEPGTATVTLSEATRALGSQRIENQATAGFDSTTTFAMSNATGSCRNGSASVETVQYLSGLRPPAVTSCPVPRRRAVPDTATGFVAPPSGGCRPTFSATRSGPTPPSGRLALYSLFRLSGSAGASPAPAPSGGPGGFAFMTERGNLKTLGAADAGLFGVPPGFTKAP